MKYRTTTSANEFHQRSASNLEKSCKRSSLQIVTKKDYQHGNAHSLQESDRNEMEISGMLSTIANSLVHSQKKINPLPEQDFSVKGKRQQNSSDYMKPSSSFNRTHPIQNESKPEVNRSQKLREKSSKAFDYLKSWRLIMNMPTDSFMVENNAPTTSNVENRTFERSKEYPEEPSNMYKDSLAQGVKNRSDQRNDDMVMKKMECNNAYNTSVTSRSNNPEHYEQPYGSRHHNLPYQSEMPTAKELKLSPTWRSDRRKHFGEAYRPNMMQQNFLPQKQAQKLSNYPNFNSSPNSKFDTSSYPQEGKKRSSHTVEKESPDTLIRSDSVVGTMRLFGNMKREMSSNQHRQKYSSSTRIDAPSSYQERLQLKGSVAKDIPQSSYSRVHSQMSEGKLSSHSITAGSEDVDSYVPATGRAFKDSRNIRAASPRARFGLPLPISKKESPPGSYTREHLGLPIARTHGKSAELFGQDFKISKEDFKITTKDFKITKKDFKITKKDFKISKKDFKISKKDFKISKKDFKIPQKNFKISKENFKISKEDFKISKEDFKVL
ncbi:hypothetical protein Pcinc_015883 [Petrolisthes cinctipes]|uniref:Uncharacterized protein n=1 Tax=Petrolisthes cinctipes TaxID=88211 RepID=A0AAE1KQ94_PETCI|nr:hypothetical protein Pcinc_015883 [Petrolisthes cinctipes]